MKRFAAIAAAFLASVLLPWWLFLFLGTLFLFLFRRFYEFVFLALFADLLTGVPSEETAIALFPITAVITGGIFFCAETAKLHLRFYK